MDSRSVDLAATAEALLRLFPDLEMVEPLTVLGEGFRSIVIEAAGAKVFRIGKNEAAADGYAMECRLLPRLQSHLPVAVPAPRWSAGPTDVFPFGVMGYPKVPGRSLIPQQPPVAAMSDIAIELAHFLLALHKFPTSNAADIGIPDWDVRERAVMWRDVVLPVLRDTMTHTEYSRIVGWWRTFLSDHVLLEYEPALVHGDLWYEHVLVDESMLHITGIVDFDAAAIRDPAQDFATQRHLGADFTSRVLAAYRAGGGRADETMDHRVQRLWELREFEGLQFAVQVGDAAEIAEAVRKLRVGPVVNVGVEA